MWVDKDIRAMHRGAETDIAIKDSERLLAQGVS